MKMCGESSQKGSKKGGTTPAEPDAYTSMSPQQPMLSSPVPIPSSVDTPTLTLSTWKTQTMANNEAVRLKREIFGGTWCLRGLMSSLYHLQKYQNLRKMPSLLARTRAGYPSKTGADLSLGSGDGGGSANSATSRKDSGSSLFNLKPLSLYKVPDTLTSGNLCKL